jgi:hypothetical protein
MDGIRRGTIVGLVIGFAVLAEGCNISALPYFLSGCPEPMSTAEMPLLPDVKKKKSDVKAVVLVYSAMDASPDFLTVERELATRLSRQLQTRCDKNEQRVSFASPAKVQEYKNSHPDWHLASLEDLGKHFGADYVVYVEIESMSLYEHGSANQLYRGRAEMAVTLVNLQKPEPERTEKHFSCEYPKARGPVPVDDQNKRDFYMAFMDYVTTRLAWNFTDHEVKEGYCD